MILKCIIYPVKMLFLVAFMTTMVHDLKAQAPLPSSNAKVGMENFLSKTAEGSKVKKQVEDFILAEEELLRSLNNHVGNLLMDGNRNEFYLKQNGNKNFQNTLIVGENNNVEVHQEGSNNYSRIISTGDDNQVLLLQSGSSDNATIYQYGNFNQAIVYQGK